MRSPDIDLVNRCRQNDAAACEELYRLHSGRVYNLACRLAGNQSDGEDLLQEVFVLVFRKLGSFRGDAALSTWIYRLATNHCLDFLRSRDARMRQVTGSFGESEPPAPATRPLRADRVDLERAIARLPDGYRAAFVLHDVEGFEHHEVAALLGIAEGTSKSQVHKARLKIREYLVGGAGAGSAA